MYSEMADLPVNFNNFLVKDLSDLLPIDLETTTDDNYSVKGEYDEDLDISEYFGEQLENNNNQAEIKVLDILNNSMNDSFSINNDDLIEYLIKFSKGLTDEESTITAEANEENLSKNQQHVTDVINCTKQTPPTNIELITKKPIRSEKISDDSQKTKSLILSSTKHLNQEIVSSCLNCCLTLQRIDDNLSLGRYFTKGFIEGELVWAKISGWWPAIIINPQSIKKLGELNKTWVFFLGEPTVANCKQVEPITSNMEQRFSTYFSRSKSTASRRRYFKATIEIIMSYMYKKRRSHIKYDFSWLKEFIIPGIYLLSRNSQKIILYPYSNKISLPLKEIRGKMLKA